MCKQKKLEMNNYGNFAVNNSGNQTKTHGSEGIGKTQLILDFVNNNSASCTIDGVTYRGKNSVVFKNGKVYVDDVEQDISSSSHKDYVFNIVINGDVSRLAATTDTSNITINGNATEVHSVNASLVVSGDVLGHVSTVNGNVRAHEIKGKVSTVNGSIN